MKVSRDINDLLAIMERLRDPERGCAWDAVQTFETIAPYTIEEAHEVADAIERADMVDLPDELGDLLLQVVFHARIAQEAGRFDFGDVVTAITAKMIRRHPHVFGEQSARSPQMAKGMWEAIKAQEKADKAAAKAAEGHAIEDASLLDEVPRALPALMRALKLQKRAATVGFDWDTAPPILEKIREEINELSEAMAQKGMAEIEEEFGDLLFAMVNLGRHLDIEPEAALSAASLKFASRFAHIERRLEEQDKPIEKASLADLEALWVEAKKLAKGK